MKNKILMIFGVIILFTISSCKKSKFKKYPTIIEVDLTKLPYGDDYKYSNFEAIAGIQNVIRDNMTSSEVKVYDSFIEEYVYKTVDFFSDPSLAEDGYTFLFDKENIRIEGSTLSILIEWDFMNEDLEPWNNEITFILMDLSPDLYYKMFGYTEDDVDFGRKYSNEMGAKKVCEVTAKIKPKRIYTLDLSTNTLTETDRKPEKNDFYNIPDSNGSSAGGASTSCGLENYNGPTFDVQVSGYCKSAYVYDCANDDINKQASCDTYYNYGNSVWTGSGSLPDCPYCN